MSDEVIKLDLPSIVYGDALIDQGVDVAGHSCRTAAQAGAERLKLCEALFRAQVRQKASRELATRLMACRSGEPCCSGACPSCIRAHQLWLRWAAPPALELLDGDGVEGFRFVTIVPTKRAPPGVETMTGNLNNARRRVLTGLGVAGISTAIGAIDMSFDEAVDPSGRWVERCCAHAHLLVPAKGEKQWARLLRGAFPATPNVKRPVRIDAWDGSPNVIAYSLRPKLTRRVSVPAEKGSGKRANTRARELRVHQYVHAALVLDRFGLTDRIIHPGYTIDTELKPPAFRLA